MNLDLKNKVVLITGAAGGIGISCIINYLNEGSKVIGTYRSINNYSKTLIDTIGKKGLAVNVDLRDEEDVKKLFAKVNKRYGRIDVLVCVASIWPTKFVNISDMPFQRWQSTFSSNVDSIFLCCKEYFNNLKRYKGDFASLILIGSVAGTYGLAGKSDYAASKSAVMYGLAKSLKNEIIEYAKFGRVNVISPGWTNTPMTENYLKDRNCVKRAMQTMPLTKVASPEDISKLAIFLGSEKCSGHITGEVINVAGGMEGRVLHKIEEIDPLIP